MKSIMLDKNGGFYAPPGERSPADTLAAGGGRAGVSSVKFQFQTEFSFSSPAAGHKFSLRILPPNDGRQRIDELTWLVEPEGLLWKTADGFGNAALAGYIDEPHDTFRYSVEGVAEVDGEPFVHCGEPWRVLLYPSGFTRPDEGLVKFFNELSESAPGEALGRIHYFSHAVHTRMVYLPGITNSSTTASEAFAGGAGVCQDFAHILLTLLRLDKIPCRYVAGLASDYGETHAWVEAWADGMFVGTDPTRDKLVDENYVALSKGRDFNDCSVERGVYKGACRGAQFISVVMEVP